MGPSLLASVLALLLDLLALKATLEGQSGEGQLGSMSALLALRAVIFN
ncbi:MAG TPA: hypothetical protein QF700_10085 [Prochlorococcus sp.]|nr:hypothetical protein [Prochlorococcus sp.]